MNKRPTTNQAEYSGADRSLATQSRQFFDDTETCCRQLQFDSSAVERRLGDECGWVTYTSRAILSPSNPGAALIAIAEALDAGRQIRPELARWLSGAFRAFLATDGPTLEEFLGIKPRSGGGFETVWQLQRRTHRDHLLEKVAALLTGPVGRRAKHIASILADARERRSIDAPEGVKEIVGRLLDECGPITPSSRDRSSASFPVNAFPSVAADTIGAVLCHSQFVLSNITERAV